MSSEWDRLGRVQALIADMDALAVAIRVGAVEVGCEISYAKAFAVLTTAAQLAAAVAASDLPDPTFPGEPAR